MSRGRDSLVDDVRHWQRHTPLRPHFCATPHDLRYPGVDLVEDLDGVGIRVPDVVAEAEREARIDICDVRNRAVDLQAPREQHRVGVEKQWARAPLWLWRWVLGRRVQDVEREREVSEARAVRGEVGEELAGRELADGVGRDGGVIVAAVEGLELRPGAGEPGEGCVREFVIRRDVE